MKQRPKKTAYNLKVDPSRWKTIGITMLVIVLVLILIFYPSKIQVGKAFYTAGVGNAGIVEPITSIEAEESFSLSVKANIGNQQTISIAFELNLPDEMSCNDVAGIDNELDWEEGAESALVSSTAACDEEVIVFEYATLDTEEALSSEIEIADISFEGMGEGSYQFDFVYFEILNLDGQDLIADGANLNAEIIVLNAPSGPETSEEDDDESASSAGGGGGAPSGGPGTAACVPQWICLSWSACENGRQVRECVDERSCGTLTQRPSLGRNCTQAAETPLVPGEVEPNLSAPAVIQKPVIILKPKVLSWPKYTVYWVGVLALGLVTFLAYQWKRKRWGTHFKSLREKNKTK